VSPAQASPLVVPNVPFEPASPALVPTPPGHRIEEFAAGTSQSVTFDLEVGAYVLFWSIVEQESDGSFESHFQEGMLTRFAVDG